MDAIVEKLAALFRETGAAHHRAFQETNGEDPDWPLWYAEYLVDRLPEIIGRPVTKSELVYCLVSLSKRQPQAAADAQWPLYYAMFFAENYMAGR